MIWSKFPWSDSHNLNLDWVITAVKECQKAIEEFAEKIPQVFIKTVDGHSADNDGNINITGVVRKLWGHTPNSAGELNPRETNGNFTIAGNLGATGNATINGAVECGSARVTGLHLKPNYPENGFPEIQIFQQSHGAIKIGLPTDGGREQFAKLKIGAPEDGGDAYAVNIGYLKTINKPLQIVTRDNYYTELTWDDVNFTYEDVQERFSIINSIGGNARIAYIGTGQSGVTMIYCTAAYSQNGKYIFYGGADDSATGYTDIDEAEVCFIRISETGIEIERGSR